MIAALARVGVRVVKAAPQLARWGSQRLPGGSRTPDTDVLFVAPEGGIGFHLETSLRVAHLLRIAGMRPTLSFCVASFPRCPVMDMHRVPPTGAAIKKAAVCVHCAATHVHMNRRYGLPIADVRDDSLRSLQAKARQLVQSHHGELLDFVHDGIAFGKAAAMDLVLATKRATLTNPPPEIRKRWEQYIESCLLSYLVFGRQLDDKPVRAVLHFNDYSLMLGARLAAEARGIPVYGLTHAAHLNNDDRRIVIRSEIGPTDFYTALDAWPRGRSLPLPPADVDDIADDIVLRFRGAGTHTFSPQKTRTFASGLEAIGLDPRRRLIVAYTSSLDERIATRMTTVGAGRQPRAVREAFESHVSWLEQLSDHVARSPDLQLAVRVHPREGGGGAAARSGKIVARPSEHLGLLKAAFSKDRPHCRFFWPDDDVSSYDLMEIADVVTVSWSTIGLEAARVAVPTVAWVEGVGPLVDDVFCRIAGSPDEYFRLLREAMSSPPSIAVWALAMRFYHHVFLGGSLDLRPWIARSNEPMADTFRNIPSQQLAELGLTARDVVEGRSTLRDLRHRALTAHARDGEHAQATEQAALIRVANRLVCYLLAGRDSNGPAEGPLAGVRSDGTDSRWILSDDSGDRIYSPMASRLLRLAAAAVEPVGPPA